MRARVPLDYYCVELRVPGLAVLLALGSRSWVTYDTVTVRVYGWADDVQMSVVVIFRRGEMLRGGKCLTFSKRPV